MSQHDMIIDDGPGLTVRTDFNAALQALVSLNAGPTEPVTKYVGQLWLDTTVAPNGLLRQRNLANTAWVDPVTNQLASPFKRTVFIASGTAFQYDVTTLYADIEVCGGGGGGGGSSGGSASGQGVAGSGGGGGGYAKKLIEITSGIRSATKTITVGAGGTSGNNGGASSYADSVNTVSGNGGNGGTAGVFSSNALARSGASGGIASGGDFTAYGGVGGNALQLGSTNVGAGVALGCGGVGGNSRLGGGGTPNSYGASSGAAGSSAAGGNGIGWGGGGAGGSAVNAVAGSPTGGLGSQGIVIITEYR